MHATVEMRFINYSSMFRLKISIVEKKKHLLRVNPIPLPSISVGITVLFVLIQRSWN